MEFKIKQTIYCENQLQQGSTSLVYIDSELLCASMHLLQVHLQVNIIFYLCINGATSTLEAGQRFVHSLRLRFTLRVNGVSDIPSCKAHGKTRDGCM